MKLNRIYYSKLITVIFIDEELPKREDPVSHDAAMHITSAASSWHLMLKMEEVKKK